MLNHFTYNGKSTGELGLLVSGINIYGAPSRIVEKVTIPYRNGDLLIDTGAYSNYILAYEVCIMDNTKATAEALNEWLLGSVGYQRLEDTYNPEYYRMAAYYNELSYTLSALYRYGRATISFDCKPQKFLLSGETGVHYTVDGTITNPTGMTAKPLIRIAGTNGATLTINSTTIVVDDISSYVDIDCESMQVFKGTTNKASTVTMTDFPELVSGSNTIDLGTNTTGVLIYPRWWKL